MARAPIYFKNLQFHYIDLFIVLMVICSVYFTTVVDHCILLETVDHCILPKLFITASSLKLLITAFCLEPLSCLEL